ncbi:MAG TPA: phosphodiester glycosidase family protein [Oleiagrimonas sp.]|nr:phosphodiester glycosidase family protein [Oleiagrimonas sp.]
MSPLRSLPIARSTRLTRLGAGLAAAALLSACGGSIHADHGVRNRNVRFDKLPFRVVNIDLARANLALYWHKPGTHEPFGSIDALKQWGRQHGRRLLFAANAGIYDSKRAPLGLYVEDGKTVVPLNTAHGDPTEGNFSLLPNGVFAINAQGKASVQTTKAFKHHRNDTRWATQSGPMLVIDGKLNPHFKPNSDSLKWRSGVCARTPTHVVLAISEAPVNFDTFARLFRDKLGCRDALYLDGTLSQFFVAGEYYGPPSFMVKPYAGMFAVFASDKD